MSRRVRVFDSNGEFHHFDSRHDCNEFVRQERADWDPADNRVLRMRPPVLVPRGKLGIWVAARSADPDIPRVEGTAPKFSTLQLV